MLLRCWRAGSNVALEPLGYDTAMSTENKSLVKRWFEEVWNKGSARAIDELLAPDVRLYGLGEPMIGPAAFKPFHTAYRAAFPDIGICIEDVVAEGDMVAVRWSAAGTHSAATLGFDATNKRATFDGMSIVRVRNGQIVEGWNVFDQLGMMKQLGVVKT